MPRPILTGCGTDTTPPCPPEPAATFSPSTLADHDFPVYSRAEHLAYGKQCWDAASKTISAIDEAEHDMESE